MSLRFARCSDCAVGTWNPTGPDGRCCLLPDISAVSLSRVETLRVVCCSLFQMFEMTFLVFPPPSLLSPPSPGPLAQTRPHWPIRGCLWVLVSIKKKAGSSFKKRRKKLMYSFLDNGIAVRIHWTFCCQTTRLFRTQIIIQTRPCALRQKFQIKVFDSSQLEM